MGSTPSTDATDQTAPDTGGASDATHVEHDDSPSTDNPTRPIANAPSDSSSSTETNPPEGVYVGPTQTETAEETPDSDLEVLRALDRFLDDIDQDLPTARERARARDHFDLETRLGEATTTQEKLGFDYVRDDGIAVDGDSYIGLLKVHPQGWLSFSEEKKRETMSAYMSFLMSLEFSVAVPCYPKTFDLTGHLEHFYNAGASMASRGQSPILQYGRKFYIQWASTNIEDEDLKQRDFYIVTRVDSDQVNKDLDSGSALSQLSSLPLIGAACSRLIERTPVGDSDESARTELCVREIQQRQRRITNNLGRTDVSIERITDRQETMEILYRYYNHVDPQFEKFSHATKTEAEY